MKDEIINLGDGSEDDLEYRLYEFMTQRAKDFGIEWAVQNAWGENTVVIGSTAYEVQWQYVGLEPADYEEVAGPQGELEYKPVGPWSWDYGSPDFEVSSYWCDR